MNTVEHDLWSQYLAILAIFPKPELSGNGREYKVPDPDLTAPCIFLFLAYFIIEGSLRPSE
jgi:hypothetical protein